MWQSELGCSLQWCSLQSSGRAIFIQTAPRYATEFLEPAPDSRASHHVPSRHSKCPCMAESGRVRRVLESRDWQEHIAPFSESLLSLDVRRQSCNKRDSRILCTQAQRKVGCLSMTADTLFGCGYSRPCHVRSVAANRTRTLEVLRTQIALTPTRFFARELRPRFVATCRQSLILLALGC